MLTLDNVTKWKQVWICKCGVRFADPVWGTRFTMFGFRDRCLRCAGVLGSDGPCDQLHCEAFRYRRKVPFRLLSPKTWFGQWEYELERREVGAHGEILKSDYAQEDAEDTKPKTPIPNP
ncbi:hypothetical protein LCGC14_1414990 [marine sediment metagenome]|uniref:Uncharacterized protein n=1 Tax=marine sediment metagenome TaxID=412755 RepID=A0A0F9KE88_9ZZZZ